MIIGIVVSLLLIFILVSAIPFIHWLISSNESIETIEYVFPPELIDRKPDCMDKNISNVSRFSVQNRGSVRMAQGNIVTMDNLEERKSDIYSVRLP